MLQLPSKQAYCLIQLPSLLVLIPFAPFFISIYQPTRIEGISIHLIEVIERNETGVSEEITSGGRVITE